MSQKLATILPAASLCLFSACFFATDLLAQAAPQRQQSDPKPRIKAHNSVTVTANFTPEELEDGKLNDLYQPVYSLEDKGDCDIAIHRYESEVLPSAEKAKFEKPRGKFLFLVYRGIGNCLMKQQHFPEAEQRFQKAMEYLPAWPGTDDSDYPINFRQTLPLRWPSSTGKLPRSL